MKWIYLISFLFFSYKSSAQQIPALLSIEGIGGNSYDQIYPRVIKCQDSGILISMTSQSTTGPIDITCVQNPSDGETLFQKYSPDATQLIWQRCYSVIVDSYYNFLFPVSTGDFVLGGGINNITDRNILIRKEDANNNVLWGNKQYGGSGSELLKDMLATSDGGFIMLCITNSNDGDVGVHYGNAFNDDIWVLKVDSNGDKVWSTVLGGTQDERAYALATAPGNGIYVAGATYSTDNDCTDNHGGEDAFIARLDDSGHVLWHRCVGGSAADGNEMGWAVSNGRGGLLMVSTSFSSDGDIHNHFGAADMWAFDIDSSGNLLWSKSYGGTNNEYAYCITRAADGTIWMGAETISTDGQVYMSYGGGDAWIVHADSNGNLLSSKVLGESQEEVPAMLFSLPSDMVLAGGTYYGAGPVGGEFPSQFYGGTDVFLARFAPWTTGVGNIGMKAYNLNLFPNPANQLVNISTQSNTSEIQKIKIVNSIGKEYYNSDSRGDRVINVAQWPRGIYYVQMISESGVSQAKPLLVQ